MNALTFVIIDENSENARKTKRCADCFSNLHFSGFAHTHTQGIDLVVEQNPEFIFLTISSERNSTISLLFISDLHRYFNKIPKIVVISPDESRCFEALKYGVFDYLISPISETELRKTVARLFKESNTNLPSSIPNIATNKAKQEEPTTVLENQSYENKTVVVIDDDDINNVPPVTTTKKQEQTDVPQTINELIICVKSYGDYRYIDAKSIRFLTADNNSTDIHLDTGEVVTAFKTLKTFESVLKYPFFRIHHSCIANVQHISRIHTGNTTCYIKNTTMKLRFSKTYRDNIDQIIKIIAAGNYIEV